MHVQIDDRRPPDDAIPRPSYLDTVPARAQAETYRCKNGLSALHSFEEQRDRQAVALLLR